MNEKRSVLSQTDCEPRGVTLSAADVLQQKFLIKFRGYDTQDVDAFHEVVAREMERQLRENARLYDELMLLQREIELYRKKEDSINAALMTVHKMVEGLKERAAAEADSVLADARSEAEHMTGEARSRIALQQEEITALKARADHESSTLLASARDEADRIARQAQQQAGTVLDDARAEAARILGDAQRRISEAYERSDKFKEKAQAEAQQLVEETRQQSERLILEARHAAAELYGQATAKKDAAQKESKALLDEARSEMARMREALEAERAHAHEELTMLSQRKIQFQAGIRALIDKHLKLVENDGQQS